MNRVRDFWIDSYKTNVTAFYLEMLSAFSVMIGSAILTFTVLEPRPDIFMPFYWVGRRHVSLVYLVSRFVLLVNHN